MVSTSDGTSKSKRWFHRQRMQGPNKGWQDQRLGPLKLGGRRIDSAIVQPRGCHESRYSSPSCGAYSRRAGVHEPLGSRLEMDLCKRAGSAWAFLCVEDNRKVIDKHHRNVVVMTSFVRCVNDESAVADSVVGKSRTQKKMQALLTEKLRLRS